MRVAAKRRGESTVLADLHQGGSARALFPAEAEGLAGGLAGVLLNTAGGVTGGDRFDCQGAAGPGAYLTLSTQAAERVYRAQAGETATIATSLSLGPGARLDWLPQETILFDGAALDRSLTVDMAADAALLAVEPLILGRQAMGERVARAHFTDRWRIRRAGRLVWADALRLSGAVADTAARPALFGANRAAASLVCVAPDAADRLPAARALIDAMPAGVEAGASARDGVLAVRLLARDGRALRAALTGFLTAFRGTPLPRVWTI